MRVMAATGAVALVLGSAIAVPAEARAAQDCVITGLFTQATANFFETGSMCGPGRSDEILYRGQNTRVPPFEWQLVGSGDILPLTCVPDVRLNGVPAVDSTPLSYRPMTPGTWVTYGMNQPWRIEVVQQFLSTPGLKSASFSIDCGTAGKASWSTPVTVLPAPLEGREPGVSIEDGANFTNSTAVQLHLGWEKGQLFDAVKVSNDGGFAPSKTKEFPLTSTDPIPWKLVDLGNERLPKTVYVKFRIAGTPTFWQPVTYTDDIILDTVKPQVLSATLSGSAAAALAGPRMVRVKAKDNKSGLASIQVSAGKPKKSAKVLRFRKAVPAPKSGRVFVRVRDGAGNWSPWRSAG